MNPEAQATRLGRQRWLVCALLFGATTINYIDRNALSVLKTRLQQPRSAGGVGLALNGSALIYAGLPKSRFHQ